MGMALAVSHQECREAKRQVGILEREGYWLGLGSRLSGLLCVQLILTS